MCREGDANLDTVSTEPDGSGCVIADSPVRCARENVQFLSRGAPKPASAGRSKPASALTMHIPHPFDSMQLSVELSALNQDA
jgi:hypothetical protein